MLTTNEVLDLRYDKRDYVKKASKTLFAGVLGVASGFTIQILFTTGFGLFYVYSAIIGYAVGFVVNFNAQVIMGNIEVKKN